MIFYFYVYFNDLFLYGIDLIRLSYNFVYKFMCQKNSGDKVTAIHCKIFNDYSSDTERSKAFIPTLARVFASTFLTIIAAYKL